MWEIGDYGDPSMKLLYSTWQFYEEGAVVNFFDYSRFFEFKADRWELI
jgi:hypothetical protein